jgi:FkbM family methyltransferase
MIKNWAIARRKVIQRLNGFLLARLGAKIVRKLPQNFSYLKVSAQGDLTHLRVTDRLHGRSCDISLREGTSDWLTFDQMFVNEDYNLKALKRYPEFSALYEEMSREGTPLILDVGANIGLSSLYFHHVWPAAQIISVEPSEGNFGLLCLNTGTNPSIYPLLAGIASKSLRLQLVDPKAEKNAFTTKPLEPGADGGIQAVTVPEILRRYPGEKGYSPFIVKIDIEGAEAELFSENVGWINEFPLLIIELHDWLYPGKATSRSFLQAISQVDRDFVYLAGNVFSIRNSQRNTRGT